MLRAPYDTHVYPEQFRMKPGLASAAHLKDFSDSNTVTILIDGAELIRVYTLGVMVEVTARFATAARVCKQRPRYHLKP